MKTTPEGKSATLANATADAAMPSAADALPLIALWESDTPEPAAITLAVNALDLTHASIEARAWALFLESYLLIRAGRMEEAARQIGQCCAIALPAVPRVAALAHSLEAFGASLRGEHEAALAIYHEVLDAPAAALTAFDRAVVHGNFGTALWMAGHLQDAAMRLMDCVAVMRERGHRQRIMVAMCNLGQLLVDLGDPASASELQRELAGMPEAAAHPRLRVVVPVLALAIELARDNVAAAFEAARAVEGVLDAQPLVESENQVPAALAEAFLDGGDRLRARTWLARGDAVIDPARHRRAWARAQRARALLDLAAGAAASARTAARAAEAALAEDHYPLGWCDALETLAVTEEACGDLDRALDARKRHAVALRTLAGNANRSRHYFLESQYRLTQLSSERDRAQAESALHERHAQELETVNRRLQEHLAEVEALRHELAELAVRDALTGLYNRRRVESAWLPLRDSARAEGRALSVAMIDIDHFKQLNDEFGHAAGDEVLKRVAVHLLRAFRSEDLVMRYGGEEFCIVSGSLTGVQLAARLDGVMKGLSSGERRETRGPSPPAFSGGVAVVGEGESFDSAVQRADAALYRAKAAGRARVFLASEDVL
ncbi:MAG: GGDEF domain-containing protein [Betaproteobacteria bacterium]|nr:GGDEF domain-containing protein [Betaproteobacteria bacterium]